MVNSSNLFIPLIYFFARVLVVFHEYGFLVNASLLKGVERER